MIRTIDVSNEDICQLQCYREPNCVSYNFNKNKENGQHKCDLNNATYEHDSEHSDDLAENENDVHRGVEVNIKPVTVCNLLCRPFQPTCFDGIFFFFFYLQIARQSRAFKTLNRSASLSSWIVEILANPPKLVMTECYSF